MGGWVGGGKEGGWEGRRGNAGGGARQSTLAYAQSHLETIGKSVEIAPGTVSGRYENGATWRLSMSAIATRASAGQPVAVPMLLVLEAFDGRGRQLLRLKTVKLMPVSRT